MINLEDGKTYLDGTGREVTVKLVSPNSDYPFEGVDDPMLYMADGRYIPERNLSVNVFDLVELA